MDEFTNIVPSAFGLFIGHHQRVLACVKSVVFFLMSFESFWVFIA